MGCSSSKENDQTAAFARTSANGQMYIDQAEDAASLLSGGGMYINHVGVSPGCFSSKPFR